MMTGIILSGGKSIRMGENKAFIKIGGVPIIQRIHTLFTRLFDEVMIITDQKELYLSLNTKIYNDLIPNQGVLGGLFTGLFFSSYPYSFCVACDMPFLKESVIKYLIKKLNSYDVIVPRTKDGLHPLHAIYHKNCLEPIKKMIKEKKYRIIDFYPMVKTKVIEDDELIFIDQMRESFMNVNTPEELLYIEKRKQSN